MNGYNREQSEAIAMVAHHLKTRSSSERTRIKTRIKNYLQFRKEIDHFSQCHFSEICTQKCYQDHHSECCNREGITTFFADVVINVLMSSDQEIDRLLQILSPPNLGLKCVYLGNRGCLWRIKPIVCEMFLCEYARNSAFDRNPNAPRQWERLRRREKRYTWPSRPVLFDELETYFIRAGYTSGLMYFHNSPGLLRVKSLSTTKKNIALQKS
jgi:hypothetical protein